MRIHTLDLDFEGTPQTIASYLVRGGDGPVLVETGPASTLPTLVARLAGHGVRPEEVRHVLVTHIHLDHAGAAGWWARQGATVYVHPRGAPHLIDPSRLLSSAERIYGDRMESLWGEVLPAPAQRVVAVADGERIAAAGLEFVALDTPGHARHHHVYRLGEVAFTGDAAGIRLPGNRWVDLPAPPPEFDLEAWQATLERLRAGRFETIYPTHFGPTTAVDEQLSALARRLEEAAGLVKAMLDEGIARPAMVERFSGWVAERAIAAGVSPDVLRAYEVANPRHMSVDGIARYWRHRLEAEGAARG